MFHQICLLPEDKPLLWFIWRDLCCENQPHVYEWQVLPFGTSSPCCASFALQQHARNHQHSHPEVLQSVQRSFYVDNCLERFTTISAAIQRVNQLQMTSVSSSEVKGITFCGFATMEPNSNIPDAIQYSLWLSYQTHLLIIYLILFYQSQCTTSSLVTEMQRSCC